jgi:predicted peptidase
MKNPVALCERDNKRRLAGKTKRPSNTEGMKILRSLLQDVRQNYAVNKDAIYGIGENRGAWVIQLISEELPGYFKATYLDEKTADGKADNKAIHD